MLPELYVQDADIGQRLGDHMWTAHRPGDRLRLVDVGLSCGVVVLLHGELAERRMDGKQ